MLLVGRTHSVLVWPPLVVLVAAVALLKPWLLNWGVAPAEVAF